MNYAKDNHFGNSTTARAKKTKTASRTAQRVHGLDAETQRCRRGAERQTPVSACGDASNGFLKAAFLPKLEQSKAVLPCRENAKMQEDFYASLDRLANHYGIASMATRHFKYPYNLALAVWDLEEKLRKKRAALFRTAGSTGKP